MVFSWWVSIAHLAGYGRKIMTSKKFDRFLIKLNIIGFIIVGVFQLQVIEHEYNRTKKFLDLHYRAGQKSIENQATRNGFARYEGTNFIWQTEVFNSIGGAIDLSFQAQDRSREINKVCLTAMKAMNLMSDYLIASGINNKEAEVEE